jgi:excisionase family DNA binding protein
MLMCMEQLSDPLLTVAQVSERLQVQPATIRHWLRRGTLHGALPGGSRRIGWRVRQSEVDRFVDESPH